MNSSKYFTYPSGKLRTELTNPIAKSTSLGLSDTTFFAHGNTQLWGAQITKDLNNSHFLLPQGGHCGEVQLYLKIPLKSKSFAQSSISYFPFSGRREYQRLIVLNRVGADLQMFISGSNNIEE